MDFTEEPPKAHLRYLHRAELALARPVYKDSLPWFRIQVSGRIGFQGRAYTLGRTIHVGKNFFENGLDSSPEGESTLIHELAHVWQHEHRGWSGSYLCDAAFVNLTQGVHGYVYTVGKAWDDYNAEQQASLVEHWYMLGSDPTDPRYRYMRDTIWTKHMKPDDDRWKNPDVFDSNRVSR